MLTPSWLTWALTPALAIEAGGGDVVAQLALADFLERGELDRHLRRMRVRYAARRAVLLEALPPDWRIAAAGRQFALAYAPDEQDIIARAAERGVGLEGLELHRFEPGGPGGLVLGFGALPEPALERALELVASRP